MDGGFPAGSVISHSATVAGIQGEAKKKLAQGKFSKVDAFFPIFDAIAQMTRINNIFYILCTIFLIFQLFTVSNWVQILGDVDSGSKSQKFINKLNLIGKFLEGTNIYGDTDLIPFYLFIVVFAISLLGVLINYIFYKRYHTFPTPILYINRFIQEILVPLFIIPCGNYIGYFTSRLINNKKGSEIAFAILACVFFIFFWICYSTTITLLSASPVLKQAITTAWNPVLTSLFIPISGIFSFFEFFSLTFPRWWKIAVILVHAAFAGLAFYRAFQLIYIRPFFNALSMAVCCGLAIQDIINLVKLFASSMPCYLGISIGFCLSIALTPVFYFLNNIRIKKIQTILSRDQDYNEDNTFEMVLLQNHVLRNPNLALIYIHVGVETHADYFLDWSLIKILSNSMDSTPVIIECLKMISFFPPESRILNLLMNVAFGRRDLTFTDRFVIYEIQRIKSSRQSSSSSELTEQYNKMVNITDQCFNEISGFWSHVPSDYIVFQNIGKQILEAKRSWEEELSTYPNNYRFREEYARFLIECETDFTGGILQKHKSTLIDQGYSFSVDYAYKAFIRTFPDYLKKKIVDVKGNILANGLPKKGSSSQNSGPPSGQIESLGSSDMLDAEVEEQIGKQLFRNARMRISLQNSLRRRKCAPIKRMQIFSIVNLFICIAAALFYYFMFDNIYESRNDTIQNYLDVNGFREDIALSLYYFIAHMEKNMGEVDQNNYVVYAFFLKNDYERGVADGSISTAEYPNFMSYMQDRFIFIRDNRPYIFMKTSTARIKLNNVMDHLSTMNDPGDVSEVANAFIEEHTKIHYCTSETYYEGAVFPVGNRYISFHDPHILDPVEKTLQTLVSYEYFAIQEMTAYPPEAAFTFFRNVYFCDLVANMDKLYTCLDPFYDALYEQQDRMDKHHVKIHRICEIVLCIFIPLSCIPALYSALILFFNEERRLIKLMKEIDTNAKDDAACPIMKVSGEKEDGAQHVNQAVEETNSQGLGRLFLISSLVFIFYAGYDALIFGGLYNNEKGSKTFRNINIWTYYSSTSYPILVEALNLITLGIMMDGDYYLLRAKLCPVFVQAFHDFQDTSTGGLTLETCFGTDPNFPVSKFYVVFDLKTKFVDYTTLSQIKEEAEDHIKKALVYNTKLTTGKDPISGFDDRIDKINFEDACDGTGKSDDPDTANNIYLQLRCSSLMQAFEVAQGYMSMTIENLHSQHGINQSVYYALSYVIIEHLKDLVNDMNGILIQRGNDLLESLRVTKIIFTVIEIVVSFIIFGIIWAIINWVEIGYTTALVLIRRLTPQSIVASGPLLNYLLNKKASKNESEMTMEHSVMHNSSDAILCLSRIEVIEVVNLAVTSLLGYTPEQLLGQPISILINEQQQNNDPTPIGNGPAPTQPETNNNNNNNNDDSAGAEFLRHLDLMRSGQTNLQYECHLQCIADDDSKIACQTILIGMPGDRSNEASSFVVIFRNEEELLRQQKEAEEAKKQSENLLYHILPRDIVVRLNQGEKNISFSVPSATIIFLDIQKFSEYAASLSPSQIMGHLSTIFDSFDRIIVKYPLLIKIKLIGDIYMAAGGLFNPTAPPQQHAEQVVRFALEALQELEAVNLSLSSSLQIRIGVNTGGPLIAGVLGTDKPVFDIIGDPINVAARLQSTDIPNRVQISQGTYDLIASLDFNIEKRGEVFLKGKGKANAYLVIPTNAFSMNSEN